MLGANTFTPVVVRWWHCIPCGATNSNEAFCCICGRHKKDAIDASRWTFTVAAVIADEEECEHERVEKDDDGRDWFYVCTGCDKAVYLTEPDEDGRSVWEVIE